MKYVEKIENYKPRLNLLETEIAIKFVKDHFEANLARALNLTRVSAPLFVESHLGINDYLNGTERVIKFNGLFLEKEMEIVQSLAKWKRVSLKKYGFLKNSGLYTDMNAIRRDENPDAVHSFYVDQWDWERIIDEENRNEKTLEEIVKMIYDVIYQTLKEVKEAFPKITLELPKTITFLDSQELEDLYPKNSPKERESIVCKTYGAVFIKRIGKILKSGQLHDLRAADYDDWELNGDILVWNDVLKCAFELSSMGIRVDDESLVKQLQIKNEMYKLENDYCKGILNKTLPLTIGGGIGQSRLCMLMLEKAHIGEVQVSVWDDAYIHALKEKNINLL